MGPFPSQRRVALNGCRDGVGQTQPGGQQSRLEGDSIQSLVEEVGLEISIQTGEMSGNSHSW